MHICTLSCPHMDCTCAPPKRSSCEAIGLGLGLLADPFFPNEQRLKRSNPDLVSKSMSETYARSRVLIMDATKAICESQCGIWEFVLTGIEQAGEASKTNPGTCSNCPPGIDNKPTGMKRHTRSTRQQTDIKVPASSSLVQSHSIGQHMRASLPRTICCNQQSTMTICKLNLSILTRR